MTEKLIRNENEAIDVLKKNKPKSGYYMLQEAVEMAIQALEEIPAYRAIGTPTQIYEKIGGLDIELGKYHSIGTVDEFKALKEKNVANKPTNIHKLLDTIGFCPNCKLRVYQMYEEEHYCHGCGQKLDWSE